MVMTLGAWWMCFSLAASPTPAAVGRAVKGAAASIVGVSSQTRSGGAGIRLGEGGEILTSHEFVGLKRAQVKTSQGVVEARVTGIDLRLHFALVRVPPTTPGTAVAVHAEPVHKGDYIVGVRRAQSGALRAEVGRVLALEADAAPFLDLALKAPPGTPVMDLTGRLVGMVTECSKSTCHAVSMSAVKLALPRAVGR